MEVFQCERAEYRKEILATLSQQSSAEFGRGYGCTGDAEIVEELDVIEGEAKETNKPCRRFRRRSEYE